MSNKLILLLKGFCMGAADVVPGVSGGTVAFILGIYQQLLTAIKSFDIIWLRHILKFEIKAALHYPHFNFLIPLVIGIGCALLFFTRVIPLPTLLHSDPELIYGLFFGLIVGSIVTLLPEIGKLDLRAISYILFGTLLGYLIVTLVPMDTPDGAWFIFISGALAISAMLLPGISGSFILLILRKYDVVFNAIGHLQFAILIPFGLGIIVGLVLFSRFLSWLLNDYHRATVSTIIGVLIGTLWLIWPFQFREYTLVHEKSKLIASTPYFPDSFTLPVMYALLMMIFGMIIVFVINILMKKTR